MTAHPPSLALLTDLYQLTMAYGYWKAGLAERHAVFQLSFRDNPFEGGYSLAAGLEPAIELLDRFRFEPDDLAYLAGLVGADGRALFEPAFLDDLASLRFACDVWAVPEGTAVFPHEPIVRVRGPILQAQILETPLLNALNFQTLIATKAARIVDAAAGAPVLEFGLRRAQGQDGAMAASRAAYLGGAAATSNLLAGRRYGIPVRGTHAHSWVMAFGDEVAAFRAYAEALPGNCTFLVDTYDSQTGLQNAIEAGRALRAAGHELQGIRLDSGDLAALSRAARALLDEAGFERTAIVASNDLDEHRISELREAGAAIGVWGVGTRLATGHDQPAMSGVYKLVAIRAAGPEGDWQYRLKRSEEAGKGSVPGILQVRRYSERDADGERMCADAIYDVELGLAERGPLEHPTEGFGVGTIPEGLPHRDLLVEIYRSGTRVYEPPPLSESRALAAAERERLPDAVRRLERPARHPVGLDPHAAALRRRLLDETRAWTGDEVA